MIPEDQSDPSDTTPSGDSFWAATFRQPFVYILWVLICRLFTTILIICGIVILVRKCCNCRTSITQSHVAVIQQREEPKVKQTTSLLSQLITTPVTHMQNIYEQSAKSNNSTK